MGLLGLRVPPQTARVLGEIDVPHREADPHITMFYFEKTMSLDHVFKAARTTYEVLSTVRPFTLRTSVVTCFPKGDDGVPLICKVESPPLMALREMLASAFEADGVDFSKKHPKYIPHVTLSYIDEPVPDQTIPVVEWGAHELVLWAGNDGESRMVVTFPLTLGLEERVARRFAALRPTV